MSGNHRPGGPWPILKYGEWSETFAALHLWLQIAGKYRLERTPWVNHSWHATFYVTPRGLTTGTVPDNGRYVTLDFDFCDHHFTARSDDGTVEAVPHRDMSIADFFRSAKEAIAAVGGSPEIHGTPNEMPDPMPFVEDTKKRPYDAGAVEQFHQALLRIDSAFFRFRTSFLGKVSPVHLFWGAMDLAVTRFSGRRAPLHPAGFPNLPDEVTQEAYSHEVSSAGFWPGGGGIEEAMFYSYAYPVPDGFRTWKVEPEGAFYDPDMGEFLLPYEAVRSADDPEETLMRFLFSTYEAAAELGHWDRGELECPLGRPGVPRKVKPPSA